MTKRFKSNEAGVFFTATIVLALASWQVSFTLGAYGDVFYTSELTIWVAATAALFASAVIGRTDDGEVYFTWWGCALLLIPSIALTSIFWEDALPWLAVALDWGLLVSLPYIAYILLSISAQEALELSDRRLVIWLALGFLGLNGLSYSAGVFNYVFLTCADFTYAGGQEPPNCWR